MNGRVEKGMEDKREEVSDPDEALRLVVGQRRCDLLLSVNMPAELAIVQSLDLSLEMRIVGVFTRNT